MVIFIRNTAAEVARVTLFRLPRGKGAMKLDRFLEFLFHKFWGVCLLVVGTFGMAMMLNGCFCANAGAATCAACAECAICNECASCDRDIAETCFEVSGNIDVACLDLCYDCAGGCDGACGDASCPVSCIMAGCGNIFWGPNGCTRQCEHACGMYDGKLDCACMGGWESKYSFRDTACEDCDGCNVTCVDSDGHHSSTVPALFHINLMTYDQSDLESADYCSYRSEVSIYESTAFLSYENITWFTFKGYFTKPGGEGKKVTDENGELLNGLDDLKGGMTLYAYYEEQLIGEKYFVNVTVEPSRLGNLDYGSVTFCVGQEISLPTVHQVEGYSFVGWYLNGDQITEGNSESKYKTFHLWQAGEPDTLVAKYQPTPVNVKLHLQNGIRDIRAYYGDSLNDVLAQVNNEVPSGWQFVGWADRDGATPSDVISIGNRTLRGSIELWAVYREAVNVTLHNHYADGVSHSEFVISGYADETMQIPTPDERPGYIFKGWYKSADFAPANRVTEVVLRKGQAYHFYASWEVATYNITYYVQDTKFDYDIYQMGTSKNLLTGVSVPGYIFNGWLLKEDPSRGSMTVLPDDVWGDLNLHADLTPKSYEVSLDPRNGEESSEFDMVYGQNYQLPIREWTGHTFLGWYCGDKKMTDEDGNSLTPFTFASVGVTGEDENGRLYVSFSAKWEKAKYTVRFVSEDGFTEYEVQTREYNTKATLPATEPTREGYDFMGWYATTNRSVPYDFETPVRGNLELVAVFKIKTFTVSFRADGIECNSYTVEYNEELSSYFNRVTSFVPDYKGLDRRLGGWYTREVGGEEISASRRVRENITLYAHYEYAKRFVFHLMNGEPDIEKYYYVGDSETFAVPEQLGYSFGGWYTNAQGNGTPLSGTQRITEDMATTYFAKWNINTYVISYVANNVVIGTETYRITDTPYIPKMNAPQKTGYAFVGWSTKSNDSNSIISSLPQNTIGDMILHAIFEPNRYTITLDGNGGTVGNGTVSVVFDVSYTLPTPSPRVEYDFVGWFSSPTGGTRYTDQYGKSLGAYRNAKSVTLYAQWSIKKHKVTFYDPQTGDALSSQFYDHGTTVTHPASPSKKGYSFVNWYADKECNREYDFAGQKVTADTNIYALFTANPYKVIFRLTNDLEYAYTLDYDSTVGQTLNGLREKVDLHCAETGKRFVGWFDEATGLAVTDSTKVNGNMLIVAHFHVPVKVNFYSNEKLISNRIYYNGDTVTFETPSRTGHDFDGWYDNAYFNGSPVSSLTINQDRATEHNFYAKWTPRTYSITYSIDGQTYTAQYTYSDTVNVALDTSFPELTKIGYTFAGWCQKSNCSDTPASSIPAGTEGDRNYYACFVKETYTITLNVQGGRVDAGSIEWEYGSTDSLPVPTKDGYTFLGWYTQPDGGVQYATSTGKAQAGLKNLADDITLYAQWA